MQNREDHQGAFRWVSDAVDPATRGQRLTCFRIACEGPTVIDNLQSIPAAACARGVPVATAYKMLGVLEREYGLVKWRARKLNHAQPPSVTLSAIECDHEIEIDDPLEDLP